MNNQELNNLSKMVKKIGKYKPKEAAHKPEKQPSVSELKEVYILNLKELKLNSK
ncbi:MAG: hypothetical protein GY821_00690 [Gammaproteobacteria bacterium]|nr:hypothetical protein [Gammaproteobacteria bacterium]